MFIMTEAAMNYYILMTYPIRSPSPGPLLVRPTPSSYPVHDEFVANATIIVFRESAERIPIHEPKCKHCYIIVHGAHLASRLCADVCMEMDTRALTLPFHYDANKQIAHVSIKFSSMNGEADEKKPLLPFKCCSLQRK